MPEEKSKPNAKKHSINIYRVARECRVILRDRQPYDPRARKPFECYFKQTVRDVGAEHGEAHVKLVFMLMTGTPNNASNLYVDAFRAVSGLIEHNPALVKSPSLMSDFNAICIRTLRAQARSMKCGIPSTHVMRVLLQQRLIGGQK